MSEISRADFWFSLFLATLGVAIAVESWRMPTLENLGVHPMSAPGLTPGLLGLVLASLGLLLFARSFRAYASATPPTETLADAGWGRLLIALLLCLLYATLLLGRLPFWLATAIFVFSFVLIFQWQRQPRIKTAAQAAALAVVVAVSVTLLFEQVFLVRLP